MNTNQLANNTFKETTTYTIYWNPDGRWVHHHWTVGCYNKLSEAGGISSSSRYNFLSDASKHPHHIKDLYPHTILIEPSPECKESARRYYGSILNKMFNETEGRYIGC